MCLLAWRLLAPQRLVYWTIDFSTNWSQRTPTQYKIIVNNSKLIDLVIRIVLTWVILMLRFSIFFLNWIHFRMYLETYFLRVTVSLLCRLRAVSKIHVPLYPYIIGKWRRNCSTLCWHSIETVTLRQHISKYKNFWKWMVEFLIKKFENHAIIIGRDNSILITKIYQFTVIYFNFVWCWGSVVMLTSLN